MRGNYLLLDDPARLNVKSQKKKTRIYIKNFKGRLLIVEMVKTINFNNRLNSITSSY